MMEMQPLADKSLNHMKLYHKKIYFVLALFAPLNIHSQPWTQVLGYSKLFQAGVTLTVEVSIFRSQHMPALV